MKYFHYISSLSTPRNFRVSSFRFVCCSIFKVLFAALSESFFIISHYFPFVKYFFQISLKNFDFFRFCIFLPYRGDLIILPHNFTFVKYFFQKNQKKFFCLKEFSPQTTIYRHLSGIKSQKIAPRKTEGVKICILLCMENCDLFSQIHSLRIQLLTVCRTFLRSRTVLLNDL